MVRVAVLCLVASACLMTGCTTAPRPRPFVTIDPPTPAETQADWTGIATAADRALIDGLPARMTVAHALAAKRGGPRLAADGALIDPAAALDLAAMPPGPYTCRLIRVDARGALTSFSPDTCYVDGNAEAVSLTKQNGASLPGGWLHADGTKRLVFLGALRRRAPDAAPAYGREAAIDVSAIVERIAPFRWRMTMTGKPRNGLLDVYELVPMTPNVPAPRRTTSARASRTGRVA